MTVARLHNRETQAAVKQEEYKGTEREGRREREGAEERSEENYLTSAYTSFLQLGKVKILQLI